ncbi:hypothetical protein [Sporosarcina sp. SAFN-010]|uniref:hypothetical protein n=1 Tax=Sporosarcina sp. SAFN-010 TaxID=3387273 RepID=UPI003F7CE265
MKHLFRLTFIGLSMLLLTGCGNKDRVFNDYSYLDFDAIEHLESPRKNGVYDKYNDITKEDKEDFIRWTATFKEMYYDTQMRLIEQGLPEIRANFDKKNIEEYDFKKGEIVTVSCKLKNYNYVAWDKPRWYLKKCKVEETTEKDKEDLLVYQNAVNEKKNEMTIATDKKTEDELVKEKEKKAGKQKIEANEQEINKKAEELRAEHLKTPEGKKEYLTDAKKKLGSAELMDIRNPEGNYWVVEVVDSTGFSAKTTRKSRIERSAAFFGTIFAKSGNFDTVLVIWNTDLEDLKGNVSVGTVLEFELTDENAKSINWDNFNAKNLPEVVDSFWERPNFN